MVSFSLKLLKTLYFVAAESKCEHFIVAVKLESFCASRGIDMQAYLLNRMAVPREELFIFTHYY